MNPRTKLTSALQRFDRPGAPDTLANPVHEPLAVHASRQSATTPARHGKKMIAGYFDPAVSRQVKEIGLIHDMSTQALLREALNDLFEKHGKPPIA